MEFRINEHPVVSVPERQKINFYFENKQFHGYKGEVISSALYANGIHIFSYHHKDGAPQGIFCANGQCGQCMVIADGKPVKACMTDLKQDMKIEPLKGLPSLPVDDEDEQFLEIKEVKTDVLIIGGGPAGLSAAIELGKHEVNTIIIDDKAELGGKLTLQTHSFFGSITDCWAGTRGVDIGKILADEISKYSSITAWTSATAVGVFSDKKIGVVKNDGQYVIVDPKIVLMASGAREKTLVFPGSDLPGIYGAGAFQTLVNRDLIKPTSRLFIVGGGNVGLIAAYHALQAGIDVIGLVEALPKVGGYKVHLDKIKRLGIPVWTSHTVLRAIGKDRVEKVVTAQVDSNFKPIAGTERVYCVDTILIAVGLTSINELTEKAQKYGMEVYSAGDCSEIAEASAAIFGGKIAGRKILEKSGIKISVPQRWEKTSQILKSKPGNIESFSFTKPDLKIYPSLRCVQEIPCNPCTEVCPLNSINLKGDNIKCLPEFSGHCLGCGRCVLICPGLAITLIDEQYDPEKRKAVVIVPFEFNLSFINNDRDVITVDFEGNEVGMGKILSVKRGEDVLEAKGIQNYYRTGRYLVKLEVPFDERHAVAGFKIRHAEVEEKVDITDNEPGDPIICRCERIRKSEIVEEIKKGVKDINTLKATLRTCMGACGGKTCSEQIIRIFREQGISDVVSNTNRPVLTEVPLAIFAGVKSNE